MASGFMTRILAVDPGDKRIGLALSDPSGMIARPLAVIEHVSRQADAEGILKYAVENDAEMILVGIALDASGHIGHQARKELRLVDVLSTITKLEVETWDETDSTQTALQLTGKRDEMTDARAAAVILQEYLDAQKT
jgi:putative Holliday junction resolvase